MKLTRLLSLLFAISFIFIQFPSLTAVSAQSDLREGTVPVARSPQGTILATLPTYKWSVVNGASKYQYQVWKGTEMLVNKYPTSSICGTYICQVKPTFTLSKNIYKWRVRAYTSSTWSNWSPYMTFTISANSFDSQFKGNMTGWAGKSGGTWEVNSENLFTHGVYDKFSSVYNTLGQYTDFDYSARLKIVGNGVVFLNFRMGTLTSTEDGSWYPGYSFGYNNDGKYLICYTDETGLTTVLRSLTSASEIVKNGYNVLRVVAEKNNLIFYINNVPMDYISDISRARGYVGFMQYTGSSPYTLYVDWAKLTVITTK